MKIVKIVRGEETSHYKYVTITFKKWYGKVFDEVCYKEKNFSFVFFAKNGKPVHDFSAPIMAFLETKTDIHEY